MMKCGHTDPRAGKEVCVHLLHVRDGDYLKHYTGSQRDYHLICPACARKLSAEGLALRTVCEPCFRRIEQDGCWTGISGSPAVLHRAMDLSFVHRDVAVPQRGSRRVLDVQPLTAAGSADWLVLTDDGAVWRFDSTAPSAREVARVDDAEFDLTQPVSLQLSPLGDVAAIVQTHGDHGRVVDLDTGQICLRWRRDGYHSDVSPFPVAFMVHGGRSLLIHATVWNRLDIADPRTGELLTARSVPEYRGNEPRPERYLDYFHGRLFVSPRQTMIADDGWVWHPAGIVTTWSLSRWLDENVWESEDGPTRKSLSMREYCWGRPLCWIDEQTLAVWGHGSDDEWMIPAVTLWDVPSGREIDWFAGPEIADHDEIGWREGPVGAGGMLFFDRYLFSSSSRYGVGVWDISDGACVHHDPQLAPKRYHSRTREFLSVLPDGGWRLSTMLQPEAGHASEFGNTSHSGRYGRAR